MDPLNNIGEVFIDLINLGSELSRMQDRINNRSALEVYDEKKELEELTLLIDNSQVKVDTLISQKESISEISEETLAELGALFGTVVTRIEDLQEKRDSLHQLVERIEFDDSLRKVYDVFRGCHFSADSLEEIKKTESELKPYFTKAFAHTKCPEQRKQVNSFREEVENNYHRCFERKYKEILSTNSGNIIEDFRRFVDLTSSIIEFKKSRTFFYSSNECKLEILLQNINNHIDGLVLSQIKEEERENSTFSLKTKLHKALDDGDNQEFIDLMKKNPVVREKVYRNIDLILKETKKGRLTIGLISEIDRGKTPILDLASVDVCKQAISTVLPVEEVSTVGIEMKEELDAIRMSLEPTSISDNVPCSKEEEKE
ncbi:MAG: hypothetical protein AAGG81_08525, partial [Chlamydiota bacterium]